MTYLGNALTLHGNPECERQGLLAILARAYRWAQRVRSAYLRNGVSGLTPELRTGPGA